MCLSDRHVHADIYTVSLLMTGHSEGEVEERQEEEEERQEEEEQASPPPPPPPPV